MNRPPSNSLSLELLNALAAEAEAAAKDPSVRCLVLASTSSKYFSSGLDLEQLLDPKAPDRGLLFKRMVAAHQAWAAVPKPTVAAIEGAAILGGYVIALSCDWRFMAAETGKAALSEVRLGLSPTISLIRLITRMTGRPGTIKSMILQGKTIRAQEAADAGLVDELLPAEGFLDAVLREADRLSKLPPTAYASIKRDLRAAQLPDEPQRWEESTGELMRLYAGEESSEGLAAVKEKRKPRWE
ncbi:MAG: enoyl-CoA hydratase/isomerase family protein [Elusimicrobia bacterium]|nr:enoyl-CoA hydratase/isomerase family protein [Elusimicrobiota bacterium]